MRGLSALAAGVIVAVAACLPAVSQEPGESDHFVALDFPIQPDRFLESLSKDEREMYQLLEDLLRVRLKMTIGCSDAKMAALTQATGESKDELTMLKWQRASAREHLRWLLEEDGPSAEIETTLNLLLDHEEEIAEVLARMVTESESVLGIAGAARVYLFVDDFERFVSTRIKSAIHAAKGDDDGADPEPPKATKTGAPHVAPDQRFEALVRSENHDVPLAEFAGDDIVKFVDALLMVRLTQALDLSGTETVELFGRVGSHKDQLHELKWQIGAARGALQDAIETGAPDDQIQRQLNDLLMQEKAVADLVRDFVETAQQDLTVAQAAKLYLFLGDFENYIVDLLQRANG